MQLFSMLDNESIQTMFSRFQMILNELKPLGKACENFDNIEKKFFVAFPSNEDHKLLL